MLKSVATETSYDEVAVLQEKLDLKLKEFDEHLELEKNLNLQLEEQKKAK